MVMYPVTEVTAGVLGLVFAALSVRVTVLRFSSGVSLGDGGAQSARLGEEGSASRLLTATRAQANFAEYVPLGLILLFLAEHDLGPNWVVLTLAGLLVVARIIHPIGVGMKAPNPFRAGGAILTYTMIGLASLRALLAVVG